MNLINNVHIREAKIWYLPRLLLRQYDYPSAGILTDPSVKALMANKVLTVLIITSFPYHGNSKNHFNR